MRLSYYEFPKGTPEEVLLENGCAVYWQDGGYSYLDDGIPEEARPYFDHIDHTVQTSVTTDSTHIVLNRADRLGRLR